MLFVLYCWVSPQIHSGGDEKRVAACMCVRGGGVSVWDKCYDRPVMEDDLSTGVIT